ncbi:hypothetical protein [Promicromonospora iranensis]|uniref:Uncharacterized protein n=1 Tax=Promicromonospora iranensis TaxID=1105144 RepID=A0ABU2CL35_9MICO|nr:hypothetical protein [Promicromonospora iranensis]MDR7382041.1 hypothetical protein [Promicromonospora iranensis]
MSAHEATTPTLDYGATSVWGAVSEHRLAGVECSSVDLDHHVATVGQTPDEVDPGQDDTVRDERDLLPVRRHAVVDAAQPRVCLGDRPVAPLCQVEQAVHTCGATPPPHELTDAPEPGLTEASLPQRVAEDSHGLVPRQVGQRLCQCRDQRSDPAPSVGLVREEPIPTQHDPFTDNRVHAARTSCLRSQVGGQPTDPEQRQRADARGDPVRHREHARPGSPAPDVVMAAVPLTPLERLRVGVVDTPGDATPPALPDEQRHGILVHPCRLALRLVHQAFLCGGDRQQRLWHGPDGSHGTDPTASGGSPAAGPPALWTTAPPRRLWSSSRADTPVVAPQMSGGHSQRDRGAWRRT